MSRTGETIPDKEEIDKVCQDSKTKHVKKNLRNEKWPMKQPGKYKQHCCAKASNVKPGGKIELVVKGRGQ
jgi:hypothetical protein